MASNKYVDLHIHSYYSDGSMSPHDIITSALENKVGILAIADHATIEGSLEIRDLCVENGITCIPAVEIDTLDGHNNVHVLAYGFDISSEFFIQFIQNIRFLVDEFSVKLIEAMCNDFSNITLPDYMDFSHEKGLGGWKALHYFVAKGLAATLKEGIRFYSQYGRNYDRSGYPSIPVVCYRIKKAGGYSVLAHPGETIGDLRGDDFAAELKRIMSMGLDGIECYYPKHTPEITKSCLAMCHEKNLLITSGSDCHGVFGGANIGKLKVCLDDLALNGLLPVKEH